MRSATAIPCPKAWLRRRPSCLRARGDHAGTARTDQRRRRRPALFWRTDRNGVVFPFRIARPFLLLPAMLAAGALGGAIWSGLQACFVPAAASTKPFRRC